MDQKEQGQRAGGKLSKEELLECEAFKAVWRQSNLTQAKFGEALGLSRSQVNKIICKERACGPKARAALKKFQQEQGTQLSGRASVDVTEAVIRDVLYFKLKPLLEGEAKQAAEDLSVSLYRLLFGTHIFELKSGPEHLPYLDYLKLVLSHLDYLYDLREDVVEQLNRGGEFDPTAPLESNWQDALPLPTCRRESPAQEDEAQQRLF
jgi:transcriptional regulator with XRE-family HTH domain